MHRPCTSESSSIVTLRFYHFAAAQAGRTNANPLGRALDPGMNGSQIDVPAPSRHVVRVADRISILRLLAADFTDLCHERLQISLELKA